MNSTQSIILLSHLISSLSLPHLLAPGIRNKRKPLASTQTNANFIYTRFSHSFHPPTNSIPHTKLDAQPSSREHTSHLIHPRTTPTPYEQMTTPAKSKQTHWHAAQQSQRHPSHKVIHPVQFKSRPFNQLRSRIKCSHNTKETSIQDSHIARVSCISQEIKQPAQGYA